MPSACTQEAPNTLLCQHETFQLLDNSRLASNKFSLPGRPGASATVCQNTPSHSHPVRGKASHTVSPG